MSGIDDKPYAFLTTERRHRVDIHRSGETYTILAINLLIRFFRRIVIRLSRLIDRRYSFPSFGRTAQYQNHDRKICLKSDE